MKKSIIIALLFFPVLFTQPAKAQDVYAISSWENLFQWADVEGSPQNSQNITEKLRYTLVLNFGQYWHVDFNNAIGLYSGLAIRNVGFIYDTDIPTKTIRRSYNLGVPLALKLGAFDKNIYIFGGGEYELLFHYKGKRWDSNDRDGNKTIEDPQWFSSKTQRFVPSVFAGLQFPGGFNLKFKYYLDDFLNMDYTGNDFGNNVSFSDYTKIDMYYISVSWQFRTDQWKKYVPADKVAYNF